MLLHRTEHLGWASGKPVTLYPNAFFALGTSRALHSFGNISRPGRDLATLM